MLLRLRHVLLSLALLVLGAAVQAQGPGSPGTPELQLVIVSSDTTAAYADADRALSAPLKQQGYPDDQVRHMTAAELSGALKLGLPPRARVFVALGAEAATVLAQSHVTAPVICALIPRNSFERVLRSSNRRASGQLTAIYLDQPLYRQLALVRLALPQARRLGVLAGPDSASRLAALKLLAPSADLTLVDARVDTGSGLFSALKLVLDDSDVLLALADPLVYNSNSIQNILLSTFRAKVPMIGFSPAYLRAGALLSLHTTPAQTGLQAAALVLDVLRDKPLPPSPLESADFEVGVNEHVARAMNVALDAVALRLELRRLEHRP